MKASKSIGILLIFVFLSIIAIFLIFYHLFSRNIESSTRQHLFVTNSLKKASLDNFLNDVESFLLTIDKIPMTREVFEGTCVEGSTITCQQFLSYFNVFDESKDEIDGLYFFDKYGELFLSTHTDGQFGEVLSGLIEKRSIRAAGVYLPIKTYKSHSHNQIYFSDIFEDSEKTPYMFSLLVVYDDKGDVSGSIVAQIPVSLLDALFSTQESLGDSEETYLVGSDLVMRTNSRFSQEPTRFSQIVKTENTENCFRERENKNTFFSDYRDISVLGVHEYILQLDWCLVSEIDKKEITQVRGVLIKILLLMGLIFIGTLFLFFEKIISKTNFLKKKQKDLTKALFEKEKFEKAVNAASDNIFILDVEGRLIYMNKAVSRHTGYKHKGVLGKKVSSLWWSQADTDIMSEISQAIYFHKKSGAWEILSQKKNGQTYEAEVFITPIISEGEFLFTLVIEHDIQKRKELDSLKDEFLGIASHELRTPMTIIRGYVSLLLDKVPGPINEKQAELLEKIDTNSQKLIALVTDMLDLSKLEKNKNQDIQRIYFDLKELLNETSDEFSVLIAEKNIKYTTQHDTYAKISSDPTMIKQVLLNLIGNAIKFTEEKGSISVHIVPAKDDSFIRIEVSDNGIGIPETHRKLIFEKFSQVENYLTKRNEGTGLGLPICKKIITLLGGSIDFKNNTDKGATFYFEIPRD